MHDANAIDASRLPLGRQWHGEHTKGACDERSPFHYSMTSSVRASTD